MNDWATGNLDYVEKEEVSYIWLSMEYAPMPPEHCRVLNHFNVSGFCFHPEIPSDFSRVRSPVNARLQAGGRQQPQGCHGDLRMHDIRMDIVTFRPVFVRHPEAPPVWPAN